MGPEHPLSLPGFLFTWQSDCCGRLEGVGGKQTSSTARLFLELFLCGERIMAPTSQVASVTTQPLGPVWRKESWAQGQ